MSILSSSAKNCANVRSREIEDIATAHLENIVNEHHVDRANVGHRAPPKWVDHLDTGEILLIVADDDATIRFRDGSNDRIERTSWLSLGFAQP